MPLEVLHREIAAELSRRGLEHPVGDVLDVRGRLELEGGEHVLPMPGLEVRVSLARHTRSRCMSCDQPPTRDVRWANGKGRAWFCDAHYAEWKAAHPGEIDAENAVKGGEVPERFGEARSAAFLSTDRLRQVVYSVVLEPDVVDADGATSTTDEIEQAAHAYLPQAQRQVWLKHQKRVIKADVVESYVAPQDMEFDDPACGRQRVRAGTWIVGIKVADTQVWQAIAEGEITGVSGRFIVEQSQLSSKMLSFADK
jgi:hypothetical protein